MHHLGLGIDMVVGNGRVIDESQKNRLPGTTYIPIGGKGWRVPVEGSLEEIMGRYRQMNAMPLNQYDEVTYVREAATRRPPDVCVCPGQRRRRVLPVRRY